MEQMSVNLRMKCSPTDKRMLADLSSATGNNESEVLRKLIRIAHERIYVTAMNSAIHKKRFNGHGLDLNLVFEGSDTEMITRSLMMISRYYAASDRKDAFMEEVLSVVFADDPVKLKRSESVFDAYMAQGWQFRGEDEDVPENKEALKAALAEAADIQKRSALAEEPLDKLRELMDEAHQ